MIIPEAYRDAHVNGMRRFHVTGEAPVVSKLLELAALHRQGYDSRSRSPSPRRWARAMALLRRLPARHLDRRNATSQLRLAKEAAEAATAPRASSWPT